MNTLSFCILAGSTRAESMSGSVANSIANMYRERETEPSVLDLRDIPADVLSHKEIHNPPGSFETFAQPMLDADGLIIVAPEYNGSMPGMLKTFIDLLPFPKALHNRPIAFVGIAAGSWGGLRPVEQLTSIAIYRRAFIYPGHVFIRDCEDSIDIASGKVTDSNVVKLLEIQRDRFITFAAAVRPLRS